ncbi:MAG: replicative DNA helicase [Alicyclobacillus sp.]|nr:replicative DNA helicase [Alicyclobacillus sp.]
MPEQAVEVAERYLTATLLAQPELMDEIDLDHTDFANPNLALIYRTMRWLYENGQPVTAATIAVKLAKRIDTEVLTQVLDVSYATPWAVKEHARLIRASGRKRKLRDAALRIMTIAQEAEEVTDETMAQIQAEIAALEGADVRDTGLVHIADLLPEHQETLERRYKNKGQLAGASTGFATFDAKIGGYKPADLIVIAARPSMGKTAFMLQSALSVAQRDVAAVFSLEMGKTMLLDRSFATTAFVKLYHLTNGMIEDDEWPSISQALATLERSNLYVDDTPAITVSYIRSRLRRLRRKMQEGQRLVVFIDYLQIIGVERKHQNRAVEVGFISTALKQLAKELDCCVVAMAQLSRATETRGDKRPTLADIRDSGQIEQDADVIGSLYRDDYYTGENSEHPGLLELIINKNRNGNTGTIQLTFLREYQRITELSAKEA